MNPQTKILVEERINKNKCIICGRPHQEDFKNRHFRVLVHEGHEVMVCWEHNAPEEFK
jgi:hypothetical protein